MARLVDKYGARYIQEIFCLPYSPHNRLASAQKETRKDGSDQLVENLSIRVCRASNLVHLYVSLSELMIPASLPCGSLYPPDHHWMRRCMVIWSKSYILPSISSLSEWRPVVDDVTTKALLQAVTEPNIFEGVVSSLVCKRRCGDTIDPSWCRDWWHAGCDFDHFVERSQSRLLAYCFTIVVWHVEVTSAA